MELKIVKCDSAYAVDIDGNHIKNVSGYKLNTASHGSSELTLVINIPTDIADISLGQQQSVKHIPLSSDVSPSSVSSLCP